MNHLVSVHPQFWKDIKDIQKKHKDTFFQCQLDPDEFQLLADQEQMDSIPVCQAIKNIVLNSVRENIIDQRAPKYDRQPFLTAGWVIRKMRYAINKEGKSKGLRIIFCLNGDNLLFVFVATKNNCADERQLEATFITRIKEFIKSSS